MKYLFYFLIVLDLEVFASITWYDLDQPCRATRDFFGNAITYKQLVRLARHQFMRDQHKESLCLIGNFVCKNTEISAFPGNDLALPNEEYHKFCREKYDHMYALCRSITISIRYFSNPLDYIRADQIKTLGLKEDDYEKLFSVLKSMEKVDLSQLVFPDLGGQEPGSIDLNLALYGIKRNIESYIRAVVKLNDRL